MCDIIAHMGAIFSEVGERNLLVPVNAQLFFPRSLLKISRAHTSSACLSGRSHSAWAQDESRDENAAAFNVKWAMRMSTDEAFACGVFSHGRKECFIMSERIVGKLTPRRNHFSTRIHITHESRKARTKV